MNDLIEQFSINSNYFIDIRYCFAFYNVPFGDESSASFVSSLLYFSLALSL